MEINESEFAQETAQGVVLVDFYSNHCPPCRKMAPVMDQLEHVKVVKVSIDDNPHLALEHQISVIPTFVLMKDGKTISRSMGIQAKEKLQAEIDALN